MTNGPILIVASGFHTGGTERHLSLVLPELKRRGWDIRVALLGEDGPMSAEVRAAGIPIIHLARKVSTNIRLVRGFLRLYGQARDLARLVRGIRPAVLHAFLPDCCVVAAAAGAMTQFHPVVMSRRAQSARPSLSVGDKTMERQALRRADLVVGHSHVVVQELETLEGVRQERLALIHNGIHDRTPATADARAIVRSELGVSSEEAVIACVANLIPYKGHRELIEALGLVRQARESGTTIPPFRLLLLGDGADAYVSDLRARVAASGIDGQVTFLGSCPDVDRYLDAADLGVLCSHHEGFSNALLEYMRAGLPVVATATGGNLDAIEEGKTGTMAKCRDVKDMARAILVHLEDPESSASMGAAGRRRFEKRFTLSACVDKYESLYHSLLAARHPS